MQPAGFAMETQLLVVIERQLPHGTCEVVWNADGIVLTGPAVLVAAIDLDEDWTSAASR